MQRTEVECTFTVRRLELLGKRREIQTVSIPDALLKHYPADEFRASLREAVAPYGVAGWEAVLDRQYNPNNYDARSGTYRVTLRRWVETTDEQPPQSTDPSST